MRFSALFFLPLVAAIPASGGPSGHEVTISGISFAGSGCPAGSVAGQLSDDRTLITLLYDKFIAETGANTKPADMRKNCQLNVKLRYPAGWQFSVFKADYRGYAELLKGDQGTCKASYYFSGESRQMSSTMTINGPYSDNYLKSDKFGLETTVWSPCGKEGMLNINSEVRVTAKDKKKGAFMTVDSQDLKFKQIHYLQWQTCK